MNDNTRVVILAAGLGTRMKSARAKVLHEAGGDTLLNHVLRAALAVAQPERITVVVGHQAEQVRQSVAVPGIQFALQAEQRGTGDALLCARSQAAADHGTLLILNGDGPLLRPSTLQRLVEFQAAQGRAGSVVTTEVADPSGYGRIVRDRNGNIEAIVEQKSATAQQALIREINAGYYAFDADVFWRYIDEMKPNPQSGEYYLTDIVAVANRHGNMVTPFFIPDQTELLGINTRVELAAADRILRTRKNQELMLNGVTIENPESVLIDIDVDVAADTELGAQVQLRGKTRVGQNCRVGAGAILRDCVVADGVQIQPYVVAQDTVFESRAFVGPFARLRQQSVVGEGVHIGNFVELKKTHMESRAKANHLAYLGDASIGAGTNVGAGTITCNYDGVAKHRTEIGEGVFVGSNSTLVAPVRLGDGSYIAAGSVITESVEADSLAIGRERQVNKPGWARKRRAQLQGSESK